MLFPMVQRYKFESKSQQLKEMLTENGCCFQWFKGTNLKANHNTVLAIRLTFAVVSNGSKVQIWKQITTTVFIKLGEFLLFPMVQRYKFESKSQRGKIFPTISRCCFQWFKGTNLKANHNPWVSMALILVLFPMVQRYKFESKSQHFHAYGFTKGVVSNGSKVQIWKQITTLSSRQPYPSLLFPMVQRYKFESKSQLVKRKCGNAARCFQWFKGTNLKANHNL